MEISNADWKQAKLRQAALDQLLDSGNFSLKECYRNCKNSWYYGLLTLGFAGTLWGVGRTVNCLVGIDQRAVKAIYAYLRRVAEQQAEALQKELID